MSSPYDDTIILYLVRDTISGGYLKSAHYWQLDVLVPRSQAMMYQTQRNATALRNKAGKEKSSHVERIIHLYKTGGYTLNDYDKQCLSDWEQRKSLKNFGYEVVTISI